MTQMLGLVRDEVDEILQLFPDGHGRIRLPGELESYLHAPYAGWSGAGCHIATIQPTEIPTGKRRVSLGIDGVEFVNSVPTWILEDEPATPRRMVPKSLVAQRVIAAGKIDQAMGLLQMDWAKFARWVAPDQPAVFFDDPDTLAMLTVLDLDPDVIMALE